LLYKAHDIDSTQVPTFGDVTGHEEVNAVPHDNSVFHSMLRLLPWDAFDAAVERHATRVVARSFSDKSHLVAMLYAQFAGASSLREIEAGLHSHATRLYHVGACPPRRSSLADANRDRPAAVFAELLAATIQRAHRGLRRAMDGAVYLIDSTSLTLTARSADWARFSDQVCAVKTHVIYDDAADCPIYAVVSAANVNDITAAKAMPIVAGATYVFDLGYYDYGWWAALVAAECRIVTRLKCNTKLTVTRTLPVAAAGPILSDCIGKLPARQAANRRNPLQVEVREVRVRIETGKVLRILTNDLQASAQEIADLYKRRWGIELFFRWIKQTLKITRFLGTSDNAVRIQVAVALIAFLLLRMAQKLQTAIRSPLAFARLVKLNVMHPRRLDQLDQPPPKALECPGQGLLCLP
jgi:IS4 transposase